MLTLLSVKNLSVIESVIIEFQDGLTIITGETGAGKSVLVGAIKLLMGERFNRSMLREGSDKLMVEGVFTNVKSLPAEFCEQYEIVDELIIRREADDAGKNRVFINGRMAPVTQLKEIAPFLADIHGQHEHQALLDESTHINLIDYMVPQAPKDKYAVLYNAYTKLKQEKDKLLKDLDTTVKQKEIFEFQLAEIESMEIDIDKDINLEDRIAFLSNIEKVRELCAASLEAISDGEVNAIELVSKAERSVVQLSSVLQEGSSFAESLTTASELLKEVSHRMSAIFEQQEASPEELNQLVERKFKLQALIKKYGDSLGDVLKKRDELKTNLENLQISDEKLAGIDKELEKHYKAAQMAADLLLKERQTVAKKVATQIESILSELELPGSRFVPKFITKDTLDTLGGVELKFYISTNKGFEPAPLATVASGGEISRVMLALKEVFSDGDRVQTLLFDEIDTGISGKSAKKVAEKLANLGKKKQIIAITHLPVVAAMGNTQFHVMKASKGNITKTSIKTLDNSERVNIIASMIAGEATPSSIKQAEELLSQK